MGLNWLSKSQRLHQAVSVEEKNPWNTRTLYADMDTPLLGSFQAPVLEIELKSDLPVAFGRVRSVCVILSKPVHLGVPRLCEV